MLGWSKYLSPIFSLYFSKLKSVILFYNESSCFEKNWGEIDPLYFGIKNQFDPFSTQADEKNTRNEKNTFIFWFTSQILHLVVRLMVFV